MARIKYKYHGGYHHIRITRRYSVCCGFEWPTKGSGVKRIEDHTGIFFRVRLGPFLVAVCQHRKVMQHPKLWGDLADRAKELYTEIQQARSTS